jgi:hypothetical protein
MRKARIGSTDAARRAGMATANIPNKRRTAKGSCSSSDPLESRNASQPAAAVSNASTFESRSWAIFRALGFSYGARKLAILSYDK